MTGERGLLYPEGGGVDRALWLDPPHSPKKGSIEGPTETDPRAPGVTRAQKMAKKNEDGILGISTSRGFRKVIICHVFGEIFLPIFNAQNFFSGPSS